MKHLQELIFQIIKQETENQIANIKKQGGIIGIPDGISITNIQRILENRPEHSNIKQDIIFNILSELQSKNNIRYNNSQRTYYFEHE